MTSAIINLRTLPKTYCKRGHPLSGDNIHLNGKAPNGQQRRTCRACYLARLNKHIVKLRHPDIEIDISGLDPTKYVGLKGKDLAPIPGYTFIYKLDDPVDHYIKYIGQSINPRRRRSSHKIAGETQPFKTSWVIWLKFYGLEPNFTILDIVPNAQANYMEACWIRYGQMQGWPLLNSKMPRITKRTSLKEKVFIGNNLIEIGA